MALLKDVDFPLDHKTSGRLAGLFHLVPPVLARKNSTRRFTRADGCRD